MLGINSKYAIRILRLLNISDHNAFVNTMLLAQKTEIPKPYLSKIVLRLAQFGFVETKRGKFGGVRLVSDLNKLTLFDVCSALEDPIVRETCLLSRKKCNSTKHCSFHSEWRKFRHSCHKFLKSNHVGS